VIDFIYFPSLLPAIFNVADVFIVSSMGLLLLLTVLGIGLDGTRTPSSTKARRSAEDGHDSGSSVADPAPDGRPAAADGEPSAPADTAPPADRRGTS
jgi:signal peptidase II